MIVTRRDFMKMGFVAVGYLVLGSNYLSARGSLEIDLIAGYIRDDLGKVGLLNKGWYVKVKNNLSDKAVIVLTDAHMISIGGGPYITLYDIVSKYVASFGLENALYGSDEVVRSIAELNDLDYANLLENFKQYAHINASGKRLFGLEDKELYKIISCLEGAEYDIYNPQAANSEPGDKEALKVLACLPHDERFEVTEKDPARLVSEIYNVYTDKRTEAAVENVKTELSKHNEPNIVGILYGKAHVGYTEHLLDRSGISYITIGNTYMDEHFKEGS